MYLKADAERHLWLRRNQTQLRASNYTELQEVLGDSSRMENESILVRIGRLMIQPSTYVGGPRYMRQNMHDALAISRKYGHPDVFITMT